MEIFTVLMDSEKIDKNIGGRLAFLISIPFVQIRKPGIFSYRFGY